MATKATPVDIGLAVLESHTTRNHAYVALTRGRSINAAWITDATGTLNPVDQLASMITRTTQHESALATVTQLHRDVGVAPPVVSFGADLPSPVGGVSQPELDDRVGALQALAATSVLAG